LIYFGKGCYDILLFTFFFVLGFVAGAGGGDVRAFFATGESSALVLAFAFFLVLGVVEVG
jgi:hypothetical protein